MAAVSATTSGAIKAWLEGQSPSLGISVFRDQAPATDTVRPYCTVLEGIAMSPTGWEAGDYAVAEMVQLDLWQNWKKTDQTTGEDFTLAGKIFAALHGARLKPSGSGAPPTTVLAVRVQLYRRLPMTQQAIDDNVAQTSFTLMVYRNPG